MDFIRNTLIMVWNVVSVFAMRAFFVIGVVLVIAEMIVPGVGLLGICGAACIVIAIIMFSQSIIQAVLLSLLAIGVIAALLFLSEAVFAKLLGVKKRAGKQTGSVPIIIDERLIGKIGVALTDINPVGTVDIGEESISVSCSDKGGILKGERIKIAGINGGVVFVEQYKGETDE